MTDVDSAERTAELGGEGRLTIVSLDSHVAPPVEHYEPFVEAAYQERFQEFVEQSRARMSISPGANNPFNPIDFEPSEQSLNYWREIEENYSSPRQYSDPADRLTTMDGDGIAVEVSFHGGFNREPVPFFFAELDGVFGQVIPRSAEAAELREAGVRAYNRWLAEVWQHPAPDRLIAVASVPIWNVEESVKEVKRAASAGLRALNLPAPKVGLLSYNREEYDPFWAACIEHGMSLHSHVGEGQMMPPDPGPGYYAMTLADLAYVSRRHLQHMIFGGVFERFPELTVSFTEQTGAWVTHAFEILDSVYLSPTQARETPHIRELIPRLPSEYFMSNIFVGMSFCSRQEIEAAIEAGYAHRLMWGRDYPHPEGTWPLTRASLRSTFAGLPDGLLRDVLGETAIEFLGLDRETTHKIGERVGPTVDELQAPLDRKPDQAPLTLGFRTVGPYA